MFGARTSAYPYWDYLFPCADLALYCICAPYIFITGEAARKSFSFRTTGRSASKNALIKAKCGVPARRVHIPEDDADSVSKEWRISRVVAGIRRVEAMVDLDYGYKDAQPEPTSRSEHS